MMIMDSSKPLYLQVEADIKNRILSKQYMPGDKLPTENELSDQYNVSKITIRKAIQNLSDEGYVNKVQGKGHDKRTNDHLASILLSVIF